MMGIQAGGLILICIFTLILLLAIIKNIIPDRYIDDFLKWLTKD